VEYLVLKRQGKPNAHSSIYNYQPNFLKAMLSKAQNWAQSTLLSRVFS